MNRVAQILLSKAAELRTSTPELVAVDLLKQAGMSDSDARIEVAQQSLEKKACEELTYRGIDAEEAVKLVKAANINVRELTTFDLVSDEERLAETLEKAAAYIETLGGYVAELEAQIEKMASAEPEVKVVEVERPSEPEVPAPLAKMASVGAFTFEDLEALKNVPQETLTKIASAVEEPWEFGKAAGVARPITDPLLEFLCT